MKKVANFNEEATQAPAGIRKRALYKYNIPPLKDYTRKYEEEALAHNTIAKRATITLTQEVMFLYVDSRYTKVKTRQLDKKNPNDISV